MKEDRKYKIIGAVIALLLHLGIGLTLYFTHLSSTIYPPEPQPSTTSEITFGGEYVQLGDIPLPDMNDDNAEAIAQEDETQGTDNVNEGEIGDGESLATQQHESAMEAKRQADGAAAAEAKKKEEQKRKNDISNRQRNAFNRTNTGRSGSTNGNSNTGALEGVPGHSLGLNYKLNVRKPSCTKPGKIVISIVVRRDGTISDARFVQKGSSGAAAADAAIRQQFVNYTKSLRFNVVGEAPAEKRGTIEWVIE